MQKDEKARARNVHDRSRRFFMRAIGVAGVGVTAGSTVATADHDEDATDEENDGGTGSDDSEPTRIDACTVIDEPGEYELVTDLGSEEPDQMACIVIQSDGVILHGNGHTIDGNGFESCIAVFHGTRGSEMTLDPVIRDVVVRGSGSGISSTLSGFDAEYTDIAAVENDAGFRFFVGGGNLTNCVARNNGAGISLDGEETVWDDGGRVDLENCTVGSNEEWGLEVGRRSGASVSQSRIVENGIGVKSHSTAQGVTLEECHICRNEHYGVDSASSPGDDPDLRDDPDRDFPFEPPREGLVMAVDNYWGAATGPSSFGNPEEPFTDPETGRPADGDGDAISQGLEPGVSNVRFDPFRESTIDGVGADR